jgi:hypothetical protein
MALICKYHYYLTEENILHHKLNNNNKLANSKEKRKLVIYHDVYKTKYKLPVTLKWQNGLIILSQPWPSNPHGKSSRYNIHLIGFKSHLESNVIEEEIIRNDSVGSRTPGIQTNITKQYQTNQLPMYPSIHSSPVMEPNTTVNHFTFWQPISPRSILI